MSDDKPMSVAERLSEHAPPYRIYAIFICALWGGNVVAMRVALGELPPLQTATIRGGLTTLTLLAWSLRSRVGLRIAPPFRSSLIALSVLGAASLSLLYLAAAHTAASHLAILLYLYPLFTALLAHYALPGEALTARSAAGLALGFAGASLTLADDRIRQDSVSLTGDLLALGSALFWAAQTVQTKRLSGAVHPMCLVLYPTALATMGLTGASLVLEPLPSSTPALSTVLAMGYQGILVAALSGVAWISLMRRSSASALAAYAFLTPIFGLLSSWALLDEPVTLRLVLNLVLVAVGLAAADHHRSRQRVNVATSP